MSCVTIRRIMETGAVVMMLFAYGRCVTQFLG